MTSDEREQMEEKMEMLVGELARAFINKSKTYSLHKLERRKEVVRMVTVCMVVLAHRPAVFRQLLALTEAEAHRLVPVAMVEAIAAQKARNN